MEGSYSGAVFTHLISSLLVTMHNPASMVKRNANSFVYRIHDIAS